MGSPRYMSPEQVRGEDVDARTDIFAAGLVLYEMLSGRAAFGGTSAVDVLHAVTRASAGADGIAGGGRSRSRHPAAVSKPREDRYQSADDMATDLRASMSRGDAGEVAAGACDQAAGRAPVPGAASRSGSGLPRLQPSDAITMSLSALDSLTVRSSLAAARFSEGPLDLRALASELGVEAAITGTLLHAGKAVRVAVQLIEVPSGTVRWSHTAQVPLDDLFTIQDSVCSASSTRSL